MAEQDTLANVHPSNFGTWRMPRLQIGHLWLGLPVFLIVWKGFLFPLALFDFWWHLKMGEIIVTSLDLPRTDSFSFTAAGKFFILQNWLAEVVYYLVYRAGGFPMLVFLNTILLVAALLPVYRLCQEATSHLRVSVFAASLAVLGLFCNMRPQVFSFGLFAVYLWVLTGYRCRRRDLTWILPPLMVLWVNLHGAFVLGLGLISLFLCCEGIRSLVHGLRQDTLSMAELRKLAFILLLSCFATLVNPETYRVYAYIQTVMSDPSSQRFVVEWQPPHIAALQGSILFYGPFFITLLVLLYASRRPDLTDLSLFVGFSVFALTAIRNAVWFDLIAAPLVARYLPTVNWRLVLGSLRRFRYLGALAHWFEKRKNRTRAPLYRLNFLIACTALIVTAIASPWIRPHVYGVSLLDSKTPVGAMDYVDKHSLKGNIFHPQVYGDYLIWRLWPRQRSFFDGRVHLFGEMFVRDYQFVFYDSHWEELLERYNIQYLLLSKDAEQVDSREMIHSARVSPRWSVRYEDDLSVLFESVKRNAPQVH